MTVRSTLLLLLVICALHVAVYARGARGGGSRGGSRGSRGSSRSAARTRYRGTRYYTGSDYSRSSVLTYMTLWSMSSYGFRRSSYYRYPEQDPEYCLTCERKTDNDTCADERTVCQQSSDCYYSTYTSSDGVSFVDKGCLWDPYGAAGCDEVVKNCTIGGNTNCTCEVCEEPFCNHAYHISQSVGPIALTGLVSFIMRRIIV